MHLVSLQKRIVIIRRIFGNMNIHILVFVYLSILDGNSHLFNCYPHKEFVKFTNRIDTSNSVAEARVFYDQLTTFIMDVDWLPIEINVPDTISSAMNGINSMWTSLNEYYQSWSESGSTPRREPSKLKRITSVNKSNGE